MSFCFAGEERALPAAVEGLATFQGAVGVAAALGGGAFADWEGGGRGDSAGVARASTLASGSSFLPLTTIPLSFSAALQAMRDVDLESMAYVVSSSQSLNVIIAHQVS